MQYVCPSPFRGTSPGILDIIANAEAPFSVADDLAFIAESKLCEWVYFVDLDSGTLDFEVYAGVWDGPGGQTRFSELERVKNSDGKGPLLKGSWALAELANLSGYASRVHRGTVRCPVIGSKRNNRVRDLIDRATKSHTAKMCGDGLKHCKTRRTERLWERQ